MPKVRHSKTREGKLLERSRVNAESLGHLSGWDRGKAERRRLITTLREMQRLLVAHRRGPGKPLMGRRFSYTIPDILKRLKRGGDYLPPYSVVMALAVRCQDLGWPDHHLALELAAEWVSLKHGGKPATKAPAPLPGLSPHGFIPDDMDPIEEEAPMQDPVSVVNQALIAQIRLNRDPEEVALAVPGGLFDRQGLHTILRDLRDVLDAPQVDRAKMCGLSARSLSRLENLGTRDSYLPHAATLHRLAELCRDRGWPERAEVLEKAAGWERRHQYPERKIQRGD